MMCAVAGAIRKQVRAIGELDVTGPPIFFLVKEAGCHRIFRKRLQRERRNKFSRVLRHDDKDFVALFDQQTGKLSGFIRGDRAGNSEHDRFCSRSNTHDFSRGRLIAFAFGVSALHAIISRINRRLK